MKDGSLGLGRLAWALGLDTGSRQTFLGWVASSLAPKQRGSRDSAWIFITALISITR